MRYGCTVIEVKAVALATHLITSVSDLARLERRTLVSSTNLAGLEEVKAEMRRHVDDLAHLNVEWRVRPWKAG